MSNSTSLNSISLILQSQVQRIFPLQELKTSTKFPLLDVSMIYFGLLWHGNTNRLTKTSLPLMEHLYLFNWFCFSVLKTYNAFQFEQKKRKGRTDSWFYNNRYCNIACTPKLARMFIKVKQITCLTIVTIFSQLNFPLISKYNVIFWNKKLSKKYPNVSLNMGPL